MDNTQQADAPIRKGIKFKLIVVSAAFIFLLGVAFVVFFIFPLNRFQDRERSDIIVPEDSIPFMEVEDEPDDDQDEELEDAVEAGTEGKYVSENFSISNIRFGSSIVLANENDELSEFELTEVKSNTVSSENRKDNKILITWRTNKLASSTVEYSKSGGIAEKTLNEAGFGFNHAIVLSGLDPGTRYLYSIKARDRWGNEVQSDNYAAYISKPIGSILDVISGEFNDIFSWLLK